jgi:hypothetical protein
MPPIEPGQDYDTGGCDCIYVFTLLHWNRREAGVEALVAG